MLTQDTRVHRIHHRFFATQKVFQISTYIDETDTTDPVHHATRVARIYR